MAQSEHDTHFPQGIWTPANKVTFVRIVLIPIFVAALLAPWPDYLPDSDSMRTIKPWIAAGVFIVLSLTDTLDGYLARSRGEVTDFGKFMDPLADKLLVAAALMGLIELDVLPTWVALLIVSREFIVSGVRMVAASKGVVIAASPYGKAKTVFQMVAIVLFIVKDSHIIPSFEVLAHDWLYLLSWAVMLLAVVLTVVSMFDYLYKARHLLGFTSKGSRFGSSDEAAGADVSFPSAADVLDHARERGLTVATAESCTGGLVAGALTAVAGSSDVVEGGVVSYSNSVKMRLLAVQESTLESQGAVSGQTACQMAEGAREAIGADVAVSVTGIAGPGGAVPGKPVGTVWIGVAGLQGTSAFEQHFDGDREEVRGKSVEMALRLLDAAIVGEI